MTEAFEDGNYLVRVRAQVMMRDDSTGGWVPLGVGGLSDVSVRKRKISCDLEDCKHEYLIFGKRIADQTVVLSCTIKKDFEYNKVMPTFHHWKTGDKKFGLTFQTAADARAFDKGVRTAVQELLEGFCHSSTLLKYNKDVGDDEVFMTLNLPVERGDSRSSSDSSTRGGSSLSGVGVVVVGGGGNAGSGSRILTPPTSTNDQPPPPPHPHRMPYMPRRSDKPLGSEKETSPSETLNKKPPPPISLMMDKDVHADSYVQLTAVHDYMYPMVDESSLKEHHHHPHHRRDSTGSLKKRFESSSTLTTTTTTATTTLTTPSSIMKHHHHHHHPRRNHRSTGSAQSMIMMSSAPGGGMFASGGHQRLRCRHCQEWYIENENRKGACEYAPDCMRTGMNRIACISCAECMLYHCMADAEGEFGHHPCECTCNSSAINDDPGCTRRWIGLALLSILVPCLWCYPPLRACHWCGVACGICGGRHSAASSSS